MKRPRQGETVIVCPKCGGRCKSNRTEASFTRYYCEGRCGYSKKVERPNVPTVGR